MHFWKRLFSAKKSKADDEQASWPDSDPVGNALLAFGETHLTALTSKGPAIVCSKCRTKHVLVQSSFMMSFNQAIAEAAATGALVIHDRRESPPFLVGKLENFPAKTQALMRKETTHAIAEAVQKLGKAADVTWMCRSCDYDSNKFPNSWNYPEAPNRVPNDSAHQVIQQEDRPVSREQPPLDLTLIGSFRDATLAASTVPAAAKGTVGTSDESHGAARYGDLKNEIHRAALYGNLGKVRALLKDNPKLVFSKVNHGSTALHKAARGGHRAVVELLLANKAEVNARDKSGDTPLHKAASGGHREVVELLLANRADPNAKNKIGAEPLREAMNQGDTDVVKLLRKHGGRE